jgi:flavin reductase (DIM6/NTAB) family NADH-FMN oxidoreductase RutF
MCKEVTEQQKTPGLSHCRDTLRTAFGTFVTGVTIITTLDENGRRCGLTANSFTSVSLDPPLLLVCVAKSCGSYDVLSASDNFAVNVLHDGQRGIAARFAARSSDKFDKIVPEQHHTGAPILPDVLTWFDCSVHERFDAGDHMILVGRVEAFASRQGEPLVYGRGQYRALQKPLSSRQAA